MRKGTIVFALAMASSWLAPPAAGAEKETDHAFPSSRSVFRFGDRKVPLPRLLTTTFHQPKAICADAQKHKQDLAIVAIKTHSCDCDLKCNYCLEETRYLSDPANTFLQNFAVYHSKLFSGPVAEGAKGRAIPWAPGGREINEAWGDFVFDKWEKDKTPEKKKDEEELGGLASGLGRAFARRPGFIVVDTKRCEMVSFLPLKRTETDGRTHPFYDEKGEVRSREMRAEGMNRLIADALQRQKVKPAYLLSALADQKLHPGIHPEKRKPPELELGAFKKLIDAQRASEASAP